MYEYSTKQKIWGIIYPPLLYSIIQVAVVLVLEVIIIINYSIDNYGMQISEELLSNYIFEQSNFILLIVVLASIPIFLMLFRMSEKSVCYGLYKEKYEEVPFAKYGYIIILGIIACIGFNQLTSLIMAFLPSELLEHYMEVSESLETGSIWLQMITVVILVPVLEELVYRGLVYRRLITVVGEHFAIIISAIIFGVAHGNIVQGIYAFILGCFMAYVYSKYKTIKACIILHIVANGTSIILATGIYEFICPNAMVMIIEMIVFVSLCFIICSEINNKVKPKKYI